MTKVKVEQIHKTWLDGTGWYREFRPMYRVTVTGSKSKEFPHGWSDHEFAYTRRGTAHVARKMVNKHEKVTFKERTIEEYNL